MIGKGYYNPDQKKPITVASNILNQYVGKYKFDNRVFDVTKEDDQLIMTINGNKRMLIFTSDVDCFLIEASEFEFKFLKDKDGKVSGIQREAYGETTILEKIS
jgi:hypothetical protein